MKISRRSVLRYSGLTAALLALTGCSASPGSAILGGDLPDWMKSLFCGSAHPLPLLLRPLHPLRPQPVRPPPVRQLHPRQRPAKPQALRSAFCLPTTLTL
mgnify:CR=1 FL=1